MNTVGQREIETQKRVITYCREQLGYQYLGHWQDRPDNRNVESEYLEVWLKRQGHSEKVITKVLYELDKAASPWGEQDAIRRKPGCVQAPALRGEGEAGNQGAEHHGVAGAGSGSVAPER